MLKWATFVLVRLCRKLAVSASMKAFISEWYSSESSLNYVWVGKFIPFHQQTIAARRLRFD